MQFSFIGWLFVYISIIWIINHFQKIMQTWLAWYEKPNRWKDANLFARKLAFQVGYIPHFQRLWLIESWSQVLELWAGQGHKLDVLRSTFRDAVFRGLELHPWMIEKAKEKFSWIDITQWDMTNPDDIPYSIDVACYFQSLHHLDISWRTRAAEVIHAKLRDWGKVIVIDSFKPEVRSRIWESSSRAYAVLGHYPWWKWKQVLHAGISLILPNKYNPADYWYHSPKIWDILWEEQSEFFDLRYQITPFFGVAISKILVFEKR